MLRSPWLHYLLASGLSLFIVALAKLPPDLVAAMGCRNRGLWAVGVALAGGAMSLACALLTVLDRLQGRPSGRLVLFALMYMVPLLLILVFA